MCFSNAPGNFYESIITADGHVRTYITPHPNRISDCDCIAAPFVFHGGLGTGALIQRMQFDAKADRDLSS
jgi:hypothetical protein